MPTVNFVVPSEDFFKLKLIRKLVQRRFDVLITFPSSEGNANDLLLVGLDGSKENNARATHFLNNVVIPGEIEQFTFPISLRSVFISHEWKSLMEEVYEVSIVNLGKECKLFIIGSRHSVEATMLSLKELVENAGSNIVEAHAVVRNKVLLKELIDYLQKQLYMRRQIIKESISTDTPGASHRNANPLRLPKLHKKKRRKATNSNNNLTVTISKESPCKGNDSVIVLDTPDREISVITISDEDDNETTPAVPKNKLGSTNWSRSEKTNCMKPSDSNEFDTIDELFTPFANESKPGGPVSKKPRRDESPVILDTSDIIIIDPTPTPIPIARKKTLRPIIIDGSNVAMGHGKAEKTFSCKGIKICIDHFLERGHTDVTAFVPQFRRRKTNRNTIDHDVLESLAENRRVVFTPSRIVNGKGMSCYDDRFIIRLACEKQGVIVSNDNYRDLMNENAEWKQVISERLLMYCFVGDFFMLPDDPLGRNGPTLDDFLSFPNP